MSTILKIECMYCQKAMGEKDGQGVQGTTHSICPECWSERFPSVPYPKEKNESKVSMKPTYSEVQAYLARQFCTDCPDHGPGGVGRGEGCEDCPVMDVPKEEHTDKPLGLDALAIAELKTPHEFIVAVANLSRNGEQSMVRKLAWALAQGGKGKFERIRLLKEALNAASLIT